MTNRADRPALPSSAAAMDAMGVGAADTMAQIARELSDGDTPDNPLARVALGLAEEMAADAAPRNATPGDDEKGAHSVDTPAAPAMEKVDKYRPVWQMKPCPDWCVARHHDTDMGSVRAHLSGTRHVERPYLEPVELPDGSYRARRTEIHAREHYVTAIGPSIVVKTEDLGLHFSMTIVEALDLIEMIRQSIAEVVPNPFTEGATDAGAGQ